MQSIYWCDTKAGAVAQRISIEILMLGVRPNFNREKIEFALLEVAHLCLTSGNTWFVEHTKT